MKVISVSCRIDGAVAIVEEVWKSGKILQRVHNYFALFVYADVNMVIQIKLKKTQKKTHICSKFT